jgi:hypothetical protein
MDNMSLWSSVCETDPENTKEVDFGRGFTAIDAYSQIREATNQFGPMGKGWGYTVKKEIIEGCFMVDLSLWYIYEGTRCEVPSIFEMVPLNNRKGVDYEAPKKAVTGAITKALSYLGFNADVFLGKFDDNKYVEEIKQKILTNELNSLMDEVNELYNALPNDKKKEQKNFIETLNKTYLARSNAHEYLNRCIGKLRLIIEP